MGNLFFNKNQFINSEPAKLVKPIPHDPTKLGRRTVEEIKNDMHPRRTLNNIQNKSVQVNKPRKLDSLKAFKEWNRKWK